VKLRKIREVSSQAETTQFSLIAFTKMSIIQFQNFSKAQTMSCGEENCEKIPLVTTSLLLCCSIHSYYHIIWGVIVRMFYATTLVS